mmetsp:Transcript_64968/g.120952  ORF Transcript_64968/g.120952 Transcript_64968/m.120952 type:complete len:236 (+) Transcript_64968:1133-1840(+)
MESHHAFKLLPSPFRTGSLERGALDSSYPCNDLSVRFILLSVAARHQAARTAASGRVADEDAPAVLLCVCGKTPLHFFSSFLALSCATSPANLSLFAFRPSASSGRMAFQPRNIGKRYRLAVTLASQATATPFNRLYLPASHQRSIQRRCLHWITASTAISSLRRRNLSDIAAACHARKQLLQVVRSDRCIAASNAARYLWPALHTARASRRRAAYTSSVDSLRACPCTVQALQR